MASSKPSPATAQGLLLRLLKHGLLDNSACQVSASRLIDSLGATNPKIVGDCLEKCLRQIICGLYYSYATNQLHFHPQENVPGMEWFLALAALESYAPKHTFIEIISEAKVHQETHRKSYYFYYPLLALLAPSVTRTEKAFLGFVAKLWPEAVAVYLKSLNRAILPFSESGMYMFAKHALSVIEPVLLAEIIAATPQEHLLELFDLIIAQEASASVV